METNEILAEEEIRALIFSLARFRNLYHKGFTEEDSLQVIKWAQQVRFMNLLLQNVLKGKILVDVDKRSGVRLRWNENNHQSNSKETQCEARFRFPLGMESES